MSAPMREERVNCSFCGRDQTEIPGFIISNGYAAICDNCTEIATGCIAEARDKREKAAAKEPLIPQHQVAP